ncbi:MAG TPA: rRNA adenine N-6-methyltransferase family protein [Chloroflexota bacterium]
MVREAIDVEVRRPTRLVVMVQREVAERIAARPGAMSFLAVMVQLFAAPSIVRYVSPGAYFPRPKVTSAILRLDVRPTPAVPVEDRAEAFLDFVQAGFAQPRKQLRNSLAQGLRVSTAAAAALLRDAGIDPTRRPQALGIEEWWQLFQAFQASPPS